jgi:UDP-glucose 4-epimerase
VGHTVPTVSAPRRPGDVFMSYFDISYAKQVLGWEPTRTIEQGLAETVEWFRARHEAE